MKVRKLPVVVDAVKFEGTHAELVKLSDRSVIESPLYAHTAYRYYVKTLEGEMEVKEGDWLMTGVKGEQYPCRDDIFHLTYEKVE